MIKFSRPMEPGVQRRAGRYGEADALPHLKGRVPSVDWNKPIKRECLACGEMRPSAGFRGECCGDCNKPGSGQRLLDRIEAESGG
jgi:hypothetical protein